MPYYGKYIEEEEEKGNLPVRISKLCLLEGIDYLTDY